MSRIVLLASGSVTAVAAVLLGIAGCSSSATESPVLADATTKTSSDVSADAVAAISKTASEEEHAHQPGAHGGIIVSLGRDSYHVEAVFEQGGKLRLHMLGNDETKIQEVNAQELTAYVKASDGNESVSLTLKPEPQSDDTAGKTSVFVGQLPTDLAGKNLDVTVPSIRIAGERFRLGFTSTPQTHEEHAEDIMPDKVADEAERELYLTPAGIYTQADIEANGNMTASQKFKGFMAKHDMHPKPGDKICPVTMTKANPACAWVVGGKKYEFCCPPCVDEFVSWAKNEETIKDIEDPEFYVKK